MRRFTAVLMVLIPLGVLATPERASAQRWAQAPNISGVWYMHGDPYLPCEIIQHGPDRSRATFVNENGSSALGSVRGDQVWIPEWSDGRSQGLLGVIRGERIIWPNGTFWSRRPLQ
jgi:hypothetical protein